MINVQPGPNQIGFSKESTFGEVCNYIFGMRGISVGEPFVITGPCMVDVNVPVEYVAKFIDPTTGRPDDPGPTSPIGLIGNEFGGIPCLDSKLPFLTTLTVNEEKYLKRVLKSWKWRAHNEIYLHCENLP